MLFAPLPSVVLAFQEVEVISSLLGENLNTINYVLLNNRNNAKTLIIVNKRSYY